MSNRLVCIPGLPPHYEREKMTQFLVDVNQSVQVRAMREERGTLESARGKKTGDVRKAQTTALSSSESQSATGTKAASTTSTTQLYCRAPRGRSRRVTVIVTALDAVTGSQGES